MGLLPSRFTSGRSSRCCAYDEAQTGFALAISSHRVRLSNARESFLNGISTVPLAGEAHLLHLNLSALRTRNENRHRTRATWRLAYDVEAATATRAELEIFRISGQRELAVRPAV